jgi:hypothetical protein
MAHSTICPACQQPLPDDRLPMHCPHCGHDLAAQPPREGWQLGRIDLRKAARHQRHLLWFILAALLLQFTPCIFAPFMVLPGVDMLWLLAMLALSAVIIVYVINMLAALGTHIVLRILFVFLLLAPCISLLALLIANRIAISKMRKAGLRVGLMGVSDEQVVRHLGTYRCRQCGYSLIGNVSGRCPECGTPVAAGTPLGPPA